MQRLPPLLFLCFLVVCQGVAQGEALQFSQVLEIAVSKSLELRMAEKSLAMSEAAIREAQAEYYPIVSLNHNLQYDRDLAGGNSQSTQVGDTFIPSSTRYENAIGVGLQYTLYDFGIREGGVVIASRDWEQKGLEYDKNLRELKLQMAATYSRALLAERELTADREQLRLQTMLFSLQEKLHQAGTTPQTALVDQALVVARLTNRIDGMESDFAKALEELSSQTGATYDRATTVLRPMADSLPELAVPEASAPPTAADAPPPALDEAMAAESRIYQLEIEKKRQELMILEKQNWPNMRLSSNYYWYGSDPENIENSFSSLAERSWSVRLTTAMPLFDGFKNSARRARLSLEMERLALEQAQKTRDLQLAYQQSLAEWRTMAGRLGNQQETLRLVADKLAMLERLRQQALIDEVSYAGQKSDLITQKLELEKLQTQGQLARYRLLVMNAGVSAHMEKAHE